MSPSARDPYAALMPFAMVFGGCMLSIIFMEYVLKGDSTAGPFLNATEFLVVLVQCTPGRREAGSLQLRPLHATRLSHVQHAVLWVLMSTLANYAFAFNISVPIHTLFRSCNVIASVILGWLLFGQRYSIRQLVCVCAITVGIFCGSIGDAKAVTGATACTDCSPQAGGTASAQSSSDLAIWGTGIAILILCTMIQAILGHLQATFYKRFEEKASKNALADEFLFTAHVASLAMIVALWKDIAHSAQLAIATPPLSDLFPLPRRIAWLVLNNVSQLVCIKGVFRLSAHYSPLTVNITLSVRKFLSVLFSIVWFGNAWTKLHSVATVAIFGGVFAYSQCPPAKPREKAD